MASRRPASKPATPAAAGNEAAIGHARAARLRYVSDLDPGYDRQRSGSGGFSYRNPAGKVVRDAGELQRISALAVPPAYTDVWICMHPRGHLQATGRDARSRKQYRYHAEWQRVRGEGKFDRIITFGEALPRLRRRLKRDLALPGYPRDKVLAIAVAVMAATLIRVGNDSYARSNKSFGLTTLRNRHIAFLRGGRARLSFRGKGGLAHDIELDDAKLGRAIRRIQQLPGQALFQYRDDDGTLQPVDSGDVNDYLGESMGEDFTAKDFRTWGGTLAAFQRFAATPLPEPVRGDAPSETALRAVEKSVIADVAQVLGNTPAVCRKAYVDPSVLAGWRDGSLVRAANGARGARQWEAATLKFLKRSRREARRKARPAGKKPR
ncbi:DNA topoisomerase IB [Lysobacter sp. A3-1-A15]|uniref:DNA topoisomerase IB n=1 Tax=Novilysobacter viscosus TaxID=3098602 RepID=UPI002EDB1C42